MKQALSYCILWSIGLFVATFYGLIESEINGEAMFSFTGKELLVVAKSHIFPMIMAMTLYLLDVVYACITKSLNVEHSINWILIMIILFMVFFVFSLLLNCNVFGWIFFGLSWLSLTILKIKTTQTPSVVLHEVKED